MEHKNRSNASTVENVGPDDSIGIECERAVNAARSGNFNRALELLQGLYRRHSALVHRLEGTVHAKHADLVDETNAKDMHLKNAAESGRTAFSLSPNSVEYAHFYASTLYKLADDSDKYNQVVVECERALSIQRPSDPAEDYLDVEKEMDSRTSTPEERIRIVLEHLRALLENAKAASLSCSMNNAKTGGSQDRSKESSSSVAQRQEDTIEAKLDQNLQADDDKKFFEKQQRMVIRVRVAGAKILQEIQKLFPPQPQNEEDKAVETSSRCHKIKERRQKNRKKSPSLVDMASQVRHFWDSLAVGKRRELLKVRICDFEAHFSSIKNASAVNVLSEAISFAKENKTWRFWTCCVCDEKFSHFLILREHLLNRHRGFPESLPSVSPEPVSPNWPALGNGTWKPVDTAAAVTLMGSWSKQQPSDRFYRDTVEDTPQAQTWQLSDDSERTQVLEKIHSLFRLLQKHKCLASSHLDGVLDYSLDKLQLAVPCSHLMMYGLNQIPICLCFLETTQLTAIAAFLQDLANSCSLKEDSDEMSPMDYNLEAIQTTAVKERLSLTDDSTYLLLDDRFLKGELNPSIYDIVCAHDGSTLPPPDCDYEEEVHPDNDALLKWIYSGPSLDEQLSTWMHLMERNKGKKCFHVLEKEFDLLEILCNIKYEHVSYNEALKAIEVMLSEEIKKRETDSVFAPQSFITLLRKRQEEFVNSENDGIAFDGGSRVELVISDILKEAQALRGTMEHEQDDEWKVGQDLDQDDSCVVIIIDRLKAQFGREVMKLDARILQSVNHAHQLIQMFDQVSLHDFRTIMVPLLRSFLQAHLKNLADKAATEKSDASREALLAEIEHEANKKADPPKQERRKHRKKKKDHRKDKDSKAKGGGSDQTQLPPKFVYKAHVPDVIYFGVNTSGNDDDLKRQQDDIMCNKELEVEERKLEETLEYQRQIEEGAKHKLPIHRIEKVGSGADDAKMELDRKFSEGPDMVLNSGVNETPLSNQELLTGMDELTKDLFGLSVERKKGTGPQRGKRERSRFRGKKGFLRPGIVENSSLKSLDKNVDTLSSEKEKLDTGSSQIEGWPKDPVLDQENVHNGNTDQCLGDNKKKTSWPLQVDHEVDEQRFQADLRIVVCPSPEAINVQRDSGTPREQKEPQEISLQEDLRVNDKIEPYVCGMGLQNNVGEYNCFLNVVIQSLWHLREFRDEFLSRSTSVYVHGGDPCVVCALSDILIAPDLAGLLNVQRESIAPTSLRIALSHLYPYNNFFQESPMKDASEVLAVIFDCLHESFTISSAVSQCDSEESECTDSWDCTNSACIAHTLFALNIYQNLECSNCGVQSRHLKYTSFFHNISASELRAMKTMHANGSFDELLKLVEMDNRLPCDPEAGGCGMHNHIGHSLSASPHVFTIGWESTCESLDDISATLSALTTEIDIGVLYQGLGPGKRYCLISMVCNYGQHYYCFAYNHENGRWIMFDDTLVKVIGFWVDVLTICERGLLQPQILFFEAIK